MLRIIIFMVLIVLAYLLLSSAIEQITSELRQFFCWMFPQC